MRAACIQNLAGSYGSITNQAIWDTVTRYQLDGLAVPINQAAMGDVDYITRKGLTPYLWGDPHNWGAADGAAAADWMNSQLTRIGFVGANAARFCPVIFDYEVHSIQNVLDMFHRWRYWRYKRETFWTMEPLQDSWVGDPQVVSMVTGDINLVVMPQTYRGSMAPVAQDACYNALTAKGYPPARLKLFYGAFWRDAAGMDRLLPPGERMDGMLWTLEKLQGLT